MEKYLIKNIKEKHIAYEILNDINFLNHQELFKPSLNKISKFKSKVKYYNLFSSSNYLDLYFYSDYLLKSNFLYSDKQIFKFNRKYKNGSIVKTFNIIKCEFNYIFNISYFELYINNLLRFLLGILLISLYISCQSIFIIIFCIYLLLIIMLIFIMVLYQ